MRVDCAEIQHCYFREAKTFEQTTLGKKHLAKNVWQKKTFEQTTFGKKECVSLSALHDANPIWD